MLRCSSHTVARRGNFGIASLTQETSTGMRFPELPSSVVRRMTASICTAAILISGSSETCSADPPTLSISSLMSAYPAGVPPIIEVRLTLTGPVPWTVTTFEYGTLSVVKITREGVDLKPTIGPATFTDDAKVSRDSQLVTLSPGKTVAIPLSVSNVDGGYAFTTVVFDSQEPVNLRASVVPPPTSPRSLVVPPPANPRSSVLTRGGTTRPSAQLAGSVLENEDVGYSYSLTRPATYTLKIRYGYTGTAQVAPSVFSDPIESNEITFTLQ